MSDATALPYLLALVLGVGTALLAACGGGGTNGGIPAGQRRRAQEPARGRRAGASTTAAATSVAGQLRQVDQGDRRAPGARSTRGSSARLRDGADKLRASAVDECNADAGTTDDRDDADRDAPTDTTPTETRRPTPTTDDDRPTDDDADPTTPPPPPPADDADAAARDARARAPPAATAGRRPAAASTPEIPPDERATSSPTATSSASGWASAACRPSRSPIDRRLERQVAVKLLAEHLADDSQFISRFRREALAAARLVHPNIVQVFDFGLDEASGRYYIVMEYIHGRSGAEILREETRLGVADTLELVDGACRGLAHAHRMGVIHRDVKPGNILRSDDGAVKLADFGIAKAIGQTSQITQAGSVLGTAAYLAPEQASGARGRPGGRPLRARRRDLPAARRAPALRGGLADRARAHAAARVPDPASTRSRPRCPPRSRWRSSGRSRSSPAQRYASAEEMRARAARRRARDRAAGRRPRRRRRHRGDVDAPPPRADRADRAPPTRATAARRQRLQPRRRPAACRRGRTSRSPTSRRRAATREPRAQAAAAWARSSASC